MGFSIFDISVDENIKMEMGEVIGTRDNRHLGGETIVDRMYANKYTVTLSENEAIIRFCWIMPIHNEKDEIEGSQVVEEKVVVLSRAGYDDLLRIMKELAEAGTAHE